MNTYELRISDRSITPSTVAAPAWTLLENPEHSLAIAEGYADIPRQGLIDLVTRPPRAVLDVGCNTGATSLRLREIHAGCRLIGIEPNPEAANIAASRFDLVIREPLELADLPAHGIEYGSIDTVFLADVLEHLVNPWGALNRLQPFLTDDAQVIVSLPNVRNLWLMERLARGHWTYEQTGLLDITHLRFFTLAEARRLLADTGYEIEQLAYSLDPRVETPNIPDAVFNLRAGALELRAVSQTDLTELRTLQFLVRATPARPPCVAAESEGQTAAIRCAVFSLDPPDSACAQLRLLQPFAALGDRIEASWRVSPSPNASRDNEKLRVDWSGLDAVDAIVLQRWFVRRDFEAQLRSLLAQDLPIVIEADDNFLDSPPYSPVAPYIRENGALFAEVMARARFVTVSSERLAAYYRRFNPRVLVLPNLVDRELWARLAGQPSARKTGAPVRIGYAGGKSHFHDIAALAPVLRRISERHGEQVEFVFFGCITPELAALPNATHIEVEGNYERYLAELCALALDIGLAPLLDDEFNRSKSNIKWLEYAMAGAAGVFADLPPYAAVEDGVTGLKAASEAAWEAAIEALIAAPERRAAIAGAARSVVERDFCLQTHADEFLAPYRALVEGSTAGRRENRPDSTSLARAATESPEARQAYQRWCGLSALREIDGQLHAERMLRRWKERPRFQIICPVDEETLPRLADTIDALAMQLYKDWHLSVVADFAASDPAFSTLEILSWVDRRELPPGVSGLDAALECADGQWIAVLEPGTRLEPHALLCFGDYLDSRPGWMAIYADDDRIDPAGNRSQPRFKPDFNLELLRATDYIGETCVFFREAIRHAGGFGAGDGQARLDLLLRLRDAYGEQVIGHIPRLLAHRARSGDEAPADADQQQVVARHLERCGLSGTTIEPGYLPSALRLAYPPGDRPRVSVLIPSRNHLEFLEPCVDALLERTRYPDLELVIVDNGSDDPDAFDYYRALAQRLGERFVLVEQPGEFNFAAMCNAGVAAARGPLILLLNNDVQAMQPDWLERMAAIARRADVGAVGARLVYPETGVIQHAGIILGMRQGAGHLFDGSLQLQDPGPCGRALSAQEVSAVTAACLLVRKEVYERVGGMDAERYPVLFNDVDFCLRLRKAGLKNIWTPYATLVHDAHASIKSRERDPVGQGRSVAVANAAREQLLRQWLPELAADPAYNRNLRLDNSRHEVDDELAPGWDSNFHDRPRVLGNPGAGGVGEYRCSAPLRALAHAARVDTAIVSHRMYSYMRVLTPIELERSGADTYLVQSTMTDVAIEALVQYRKFNRTRLVLAIDDRVTDLPPTHPHYEKRFRDARYRLRREIAACHRVIVTTEPLVEFCRQFTDDVRLVPNYLEREAWQGLVSRRATGNRPRVGWAGGQQHVGDLRLIAEVVKATAAEVDWIFFGMCPDELAPYVREAYAFEKSYPDYLRRLSSLNLDLAVAPLEVNAFNEAKSNLKLLEYGCLGWPTICSDLPAYRDAPVCRVENTTAAWLSAIRERIHAPATTYAEGDRLQAWVRQGFFLEDHLEEWARALVE